ncbi:phosphoribosyltransferase family protein [Nesterenkonia sp.]|uniref:ComF family protein n=1 Tax=Nesterenkonia sp. TaxID=704201 RepID=UPI00261145B8|nr:phosphoribosyltransferase family protein [Nesterenkonia sp.]
MLRRLDAMWFSPAARSLRAAVGRAADLVMPAWCVGCRAEGCDLCPACDEEIRLRTRRPFRAEAAAEALPLLEDLQVLPVYSAAEYSTLIAEAMLAFKEHERIRLAGALAPGLGRALAAAAQSCRSEQPLLIWPPPSPRSQLRRGRHPLGELLARARVPEHLRPAAGLLRHRVSAADLAPAGRGQKTRSKSARRQAADRFRLTAQGAEQLPGAEVILVDDVLTTGSTLAALYRVLTEAGAAVPAAAVLAASPGTPQDTGVDAGQE